MGGGGYGNCDDVDDDGDDGDDDNGDDDDDEEEEEEDDDGDDAVDADVGDDVEAGKVDRDALAVCVKVGNEEELDGNSNEGDDCDEDTVFFPSSYLPSKRVTSLLVISTSLLKLLSFSYAEAISNAVGGIARSHSSIQKGAMRAEERARSSNASIKP